MAVFLSITSLFSYIWKKYSWCPQLQKPSSSLSMEYIPLTFYICNSIFTVAISSFSEWIQNRAGHVLKIQSVCRRYSTLPRLVMCDINPGKQITIPMRHSMKTCSEELSWMTAMQLSTFSYNSHKIAEWLSVAPQAPCEKHRMVTSLSIWCVARWNLLLSEFVVWAFSLGKSLQLLLFPCALSI